MFCLEFLWQFRLPIILGGKKNIAGVMVALSVSLVRSVLISGQTSIIKWDRKAGTKGGGKHTRNKN